MEQNENTLSVLKIAPGQYPQQVEIDNDLKALQQAVGGSIGASYPLLMTRSPSSITMTQSSRVCPEPCPLGRGRADVRCHCRNLSGGGAGRGGLCIALPELAQKYEEEFHQPEAFLPLGRRLMVIPVPDESIRSDAEKAVSKPRWNMTVKLRFSQGGGDNAGRNRA